MDYDTRYRNSLTSLVMSDFAWGLAYDSLRSAVSEEVLTPEAIRDSARHLALMGDLDMMRLDAQVIFGLSPESEERLPAGLAGELLAFAADLLVGVDDVDAHFYAIALREYADRAHDIEHG